MSASIVKSALPHPLKRRPRDSPQTGTECSGVRIDDECLGKVVGSIGIGQKHCETCHDRQSPGNNMQEKKRRRISPAAGWRSILPIDLLEPAPRPGQDDSDGLQAAQATMEARSRDGERDIPCRGSVARFARVLIDARRDGQEVQRRVHEFRLGALHLAPMLLEHPTVTRARCAIALLE